MEGDLFSAATSIPTRGQSQGTASPPAKRPRPTLLHDAGSITGLPNTYVHFPVLGNGSSSQSSSSFTPESQSGPASTSSLSSPLMASPEPSGLAASLDSIKEPEPDLFTFAYPMALPARVRFPLIDSSEPDSIKNNDTIPESALVLATNGNNAVDDEPPNYDYETEDEDPVSESQCERSVVVPGEVAQGQPGPIEQAPEQPMPEEGEIVGIPAMPVCSASGQNVTWTKTRDEYVKYLIGRLRKFEFDNGCTTAEWLQKYPMIKEVAMDVADKVYGPQEEQKDVEENNEGSKGEIEEAKEETKEDKKTKEECEAQGHQPTPTQPSPPQSSFNSVGNGSRGRKLVTRFFQKIKSLFKKSEQANSSYEMAELTRVKTNAPKGKERATVMASPILAPRVVQANGNVEEVENGYFVRIVPATVTRRSQIWYGEEKGETSAEGARMNSRTACGYTDVEAAVSPFATIPGSELIPRR